MIPTYQTTRYHNQTGHDYKSLRHRQNHKSQVKCSYHGLSVRLYRGAVQRRYKRGDDEQRRPQQQKERRTVDSNWTHCVYGVWKAKFAVTVMNPALLASSTLVSARRYHTVQLCTLHTTELNSAVWSLDKYVLKCRDYSLQPRPPGNTVQLNEPVYNTLTFILPPLSCSTCNWGTTS
jgi:hypothetical protein